MKKLFLFALLFAATAMTAETRVETFTNTGGNTATYVTSETSRKCDQATWTVFSGGILTGVGNFSSTAAVIRAKKSSETVYPYIKSDVIPDGIDTLWLTWNSNGDESKGTWNIKVYINDVEVGALQAPGNKKDATPYREFGIGNLKIEGDFTIKFVNESEYEGTGNFLRFVFDNLSWKTYGKASKLDPELEFAEESVIKKIDAAAFTNVLSNKSDAAPAFVSEHPEVATVDPVTGEVTVVGLGYTTITASVAETETYKADEASYTFRVVPLNFNLETFDGAANVTIGGAGTYSTTVVTSENPSTATGLKWTSYLGSVRDALGGSPNTNMAGAIRATKGEETTHGYLLSSTVSGGIDSIAFDWNCNGTEAAREHPWDIEVYINDELIGTINDACTAVQPMGSWFRFTKGNLKVDGDFTIKIVNKNVSDNGKDNQYRWVVDNIEWYSYEAPKYAVTFNAMPENGLLAVLNGSTPLTSGAEVKAGTTLTIVPTPGDGYKVKSVTVNGDPITPVESVYSCVTTAAPTAIAAEFEKDSSTGIDNMDVNADVRKTVENGIVVIYRNGIRYNLQGQAL